MPVADYSFLSSGIEMLAPCVARLAISTVDGHAVAVVLFPADCDNHSRNAGLRLPRSALPALAVG
jgi:hypothetical protein